ncbi:MAG: LysR family transcriptional regulator [Rhodobacteraceae bacterium]|nr:LysR family transcriptional regulator [Paracoccaceae bacterium]
MNAHNGTSQNWDEIHTAYQVARLGTLSAAAAYLGVHHATVMRHIDNLERRLGAKLFHRHPRGYAPTEAGKDLMRIAATTDDQFTQMMARIRDNKDTVSGDLIVTTLSGLSPMFTPILAAFQQKHPAVRVSLLAEERLLKMEYGEAHVALRVGRQPTEPDNIVRHMCNLPMTLYAHKSYIEKHGMLNGIDDIKNHKFVLSGDKNSPAPFTDWVNQHVDDSQIVFRAPQMRSLDDAIIAGAGIGFMIIWMAQKNPDLVQMMPSKPEWDNRIWQVTHVDLHRTAKVQAFLAFLNSTCGD